MKKGFASLAKLEAYVNDKAEFDTGAHNEDIHRESDSEVRATKKWPHPRWVRINTLRTTLDEQLKTTFAGYKLVDSIGQLLQDGGSSSTIGLLHIDRHIADLVAVICSNQFTKSPAYLNGLVILQDKGSCFPAYLLEPKVEEGDILDACAAPGNKTTHLAALLGGGTSSAQKSRIWACERDKGRSQMLEKLVEVAGAKDVVNIKAGQDFLSLNPQTAPWNKIGSLLLDPSCSGSGIVGRDKILNVVLPEIQNTRENNPKSLKRKRQKRVKIPPIVADLEQEPSSIDDNTQNSARLKALSTFQLKLLLHAFQFPKAQKIVYSTCSLYAQENEHVVIRALGSPVARERGWRILRREEQVHGAKAWAIRGDYTACQNILDIGGVLGVSEIAEHCIRCEKGTEEGTQGFFVAVFVRDGKLHDVNMKPWVANSTAATLIPDTDACNSSDEKVDPDQEWEGFGDDNASIASMN